MRPNVGHRDFAWAISSRISYALWRKSYTGGLPARVRAFWHHVMRGYGSETCGECGRPVGQVWFAAEPIWRMIMPSEGGLFCIPCFDRRLADLGYFVRWNPAVERATRPPRPRRPARANR